MAKPDLLSVAGVILEEALKIPAESLANEGITADDLTTLKNLIDVFNNVKSSPEEAVVQK